MNNRSIKRLANVSLRETNDELPDWQNAWSTVLVPSRTACAEQGPSPWAVWHFASSCLAWWSRPPCTGVRRPTADRVVCSRGRDLCREDRICETRSGPSGDCFSSSAHSNGCSVWSRCCWKRRPQFSPQSVPSGCWTGSLLLQASCSTNNLGWYPNCSSPILLPLAPSCNIWAERSVPENRQIHHCQFVRFVRYIGIVPLLPLAFHLSAFLLFLSLSFRLTLNWYRWHHRWLE